MASKKSDEFFFKRLENTIHKLRNNICAGIDPDAELLSSPFFEKEIKGEGIRNTLSKFGCTIIDSVKNFIGSIKIQSAYFERFGGEGIFAAKDIVSYAQHLGVLTIFDGKRSDIPSTMKAYGQSVFEFMNADAMTVVPYFGIQSFQPLTEWLVKGKGIYIVLLSSNPEGTSLQQNISSLIADSLNDWADQEKISDAIGLVVGAQKLTSENSALLTSLSRYGFLCPGVGAQGADLKTALDFLRFKPRNIDLFPISRGLIRSEKQTIHSWSDFSTIVKKNAETYALLANFKKS